MDNVAFNYEINRVVAGFADIFKSFCALKKLKVSL